MSTFFPKDKDRRSEYAFEETGDGRKADIYWSQPYATRAYNHRRVVRPGRTREYAANIEPINYEPTPYITNRARVNARDRRRIYDPSPIADEGYLAEDRDDDHVKTKEGVLETVTAEYSEIRRSSDPEGAENEAASLSDTGSRESGEDFESETSSVTSFDFNSVYRDEDTVGIKDGQTDPTLNQTKPSKDTATPPWFNAKCDAKVTNESIIRSRYLKSDTGISDGVAELCFGRDGVRDDQTDHEPLFRWTHLTNSVLDFEDMIAAIRDAPGLEALDKETIIKQVEVFRRSNEKPLRAPGGIRGRYIEGDGLEAVYTHESTEETTKSAIIILSIPYFSLEKYVANNLSENSTAHFPRTLLQSVQSTTQKERDLQQAVCQLDGTPKGHCFRVPQLWCCIFNECHIITFSHLNETEICGNMLQVKKMPVSSYTSLQVTDGYNVWQLPIEDCETWIAFHSNLLTPKPFETELFMRKPNVFHGKKKVHSHMWPRLIARARVHPMTLFVSVRNQFGDNMSIGSGIGGRQDNEDDHYYPNSQAGSETRERNNAEVSEKDKKDKKMHSWPHHPSKGLAKRNVSDFSEFHLYTWVVAKESELQYNQIHRKTQLFGKKDHVPENNDPLLLKEKLNTFLDRLLNVFTQSLNRDQFAAYQACPTNTVQDVDRLIEQSGALINDDYMLYDTNNDFLIGSKQFFEFYLPFSCDHIFAQKYWGAICSASKEQPRGRGDHSLFRSNEMRLFLSCANLVKDTQKEMSGGRGPLPWKSEMPEQLQKAWLHCFMYHLPKNEQNARRALPPANGKVNHIQRCMDLLLEGRDRLLISFRGEPLSRKQAVLPHSIATILCEYLVGDITGKLPDMPNTYESYFKNLVMQVQTEPLKRQHQGKISFLRQEIQAILRTLEQQGKVLSHLHQYMDSKLDQAKGYLPDASSQRDYMPIENALATITNRIDGFREISDQASELERWSIRQIETNKDRQEAAIYAFTVVTVIFLPLSFITSFLGMNTTDVRDTPHTQWVFWAAALPLTAIILTIGIIWTGELGNTTRAFVNFFTRRKNSASLSAPWVPDDEVLLLPGGGANYATPKILEDIQNRMWMYGPPERAATGRSGPRP